MDAKVRTILLEFKVKQDQFESLHTSIVSKLNNEGGHQLTLVFEDEQRKIYVGESGVLNLTLALPVCTLNFEIIRYVNTERSRYLL